MVGKKSGRALLRDEGTTCRCALRIPRGVLYGSASSPLSRPKGASANARNGNMHTKPSRIGLQRTDNNMEFTTWPQVAMINQKNYYT